MKILFVHQSFPAQFLHLAPTLSRIPGYEVRVLSMKELPVSPGIEVTRYQTKRRPCSGTHPWMKSLERAVINGEGAYAAASKLCDEGYHPDLIVAHPRWGECLFLKAIWPKSKLALYLEYYFNHKGGYLDFDPEFASKKKSLSNTLKLTNAAFDLVYSEFDRGISPTLFQRSTFPIHFQNKIDVLHEGVDTTLIKPDKDASLEADGFIFSRKEEIITYVSRSLEPTRGFHVFMRALPEIMRRRSSAKVIIVGMESPSYNTGPLGDGTWKDLLLKEISPSIDLNRIYFLGKADYEDIIKVLQISTVHIHLSYPFTLSWSVLEAMSAGCAIVASDNKPVNEVIENCVTGRLVNFFDIDNLAQAVVHLLEDQSTREKLGAAARNYVMRKYDLRTVCLPKQLKWVESLMESE